jgi:hypothetical protein
LVASTEGLYRLLGLGQQRLRQSDDQSQQTTRTLHRAKALVRLKNFQRRFIRLCLLIRVLPQLQPGNLVAMNFVRSIGKASRRAVV